MNAKEILEKTGIDVEAQIDGTPFKWRDALLLRKLGTYALPSELQRENIRQQAHALSNVVSLIGKITITSWLRTPDYNKQIGGATRSVHLTGLATDFVPQDISVEEAKKEIQASGIYPGGGEINSTTWVHLDLMHQKWFMA